jgi:hypothetical protein
MKHICLVGVAILLAACSSHRVRCDGALRPINRPAAAKPTVPGSAASPRAATAVPGAVTAAPAAAQPQPLPAEPQP